MSEVQYRFAEIEDLPRIVEIYNTTIESRMVTADLEPVTIEERQPWFAQHNKEQRPLWVAVENEEIIGWLSFQSFYGRIAYHNTVEISIYLAPEARGKGLGKSFIEFALDQAPKFGIENIMGFIFSHNIPSLHIFEKLGFEKWGEFPEIATLDGIKRSLTILGKKI